MLIASLLESKRDTNVGFSERCEVKIPNDSFTMKIKKHTIEQCRLIVNEFCKLGLRDVLVDKGAICSNLEHVKFNECNCTYDLREFVNRSTHMI